MSTVSEVNSPHAGANPWILKSINGIYTYQVAEFNPLTDNSYVSISVFENGNRIYHKIVRGEYISSDE